MCPSHTDFCKHCSVYTIRSLLSTIIMQLTTFTNLLFPSSPLLVTTTLFSVLCGITCFLFVLVWDVHLFCYLFNSSHMSEITFFFLFNLFHLLSYPQGPSMFSKVVRFHLFFMTD